MEFDSRSYWKPRDLAALLDVGLSRGQQLIEDGELEHRRIGECAIRIPARAVAGLRGEEAPVVSPTTEGPPADLAERVDRFFESTGRHPGDRGERLRRHWGICARTPRFTSRNMKRPTAAYPMIQVIGGFRRQRNVAISKNNPLE